MAFDIVISVAAKVAELLVVPIGRQIGYVFNYNDNIDNLKSQLEKLTVAKERVQHDVDCARQQGEEIEADVQKWLSNVNAITEETEKFFEDEGKAKKKCFMGLCPNFKARYQLSRKAKKKSRVVVEFHAEGKFDGVSYRAASQGTGVVLFKDYEAFESRTLVLNQIVESLKDAEVDRIGVFGLGGVGKTTLVKKVAEQVRVNETFSVVVLAVVSQTVDLRRVQGEIADGLNFKLDAETVKGRADQLRERLKKEKKLLIILDDIWERIELEEIGIPQGNDHRGHKILLTSRYQNALSIDMGTHKDFHIEVLLDEEAWNLFDKMVGGVKDPNLLPIATEVAKRCARLPVLIAAVAMALKGKDFYAWQDALTRLSSFDNEGMHAKVYSALELSYNHLGGDEIKSLFLLCGLVVCYSFSIRDLLMYCMGLGLFRHLNTVEEGRNRLQSLVSDLKANCLLLDGIGNGEILMHDVVRKFAVSVASRVHNVLAVEYGGELKEWPEKNVLQNCRMMSFIHSNLPELPERLECPELVLFLLYSKEADLKIPESLFEGMRGLKVLDITEVRLTSLPSSVPFLENLRTLSLYGCALENIAIIGKLKTLQVLCIANSELVCLPREISELTNLQLLELRRCSNLLLIPPNVLSCLTKLEELCLENSFNQWDLEGTSGERNNASLAELKHLSNLSSLDIHVPDSRMMPKDLSFEKLERFRIFIGDVWDWFGNYETSKTLKLKLSTSIQLEAGIKLLLRGTEDLYVSELKYVKHFLSDLDWEGFPHLKHLHVQNSPEILYMVNSMEWIPGNAFPVLESMFLNNLINLEKVWHGHLNSETFCRLQILKVEECNRLKALFCFAMARGLLKLEEIEATNCKRMQVIVAEKSDEKVSEDEEIKWIKLRCLTLKCLPELTNFCSEVMAPSTTPERHILLATDTRSNEIVSRDEPATSVPLFSKKIVFPNLEELKLCSIKVEKIWHNQPVSCILKLTSLTVEGCWNLKYLFTYSMVKSLAHLKKVEVCNCKLMEEIIFTEGLGEGEIVNQQLLFPKLAFLKLKGLPKLKRFCTSHLIKCPSLKELHIEKCPEMKTFVCNCLSVDLTVNSELLETNPTLFDEKVAFPNLEEMRIFSMDNLKMIWHNELHSDSFGKLKALKVKQGKKLLNIFPPNMLRRFQHLETLVLRDCASLEEVFDLQSLMNEKATHFAMATQLRTIDIENLPNLKSLWNKNPRGILSFRHLRSVRVWNCPSLKSLFPVSVALGLLQLEELNIDSCGLEEIVSEEEGVETVNVRFVFPKITFLLLWRLPEFKGFYPKRHTLEWPVLKKLSVYHCEKMPIFDLESQNFQGPCLDDQLEIKAQQPLFSFRKIISNLEELALNSTDITIIKRGHFSVELFHKLKVLELQCFYDKSADFPFDVLQRVQNVEKLIVRHGLFSELISCRHVGEEDYVSTLARIRYLKLDYLPNLRRFWNHGFLTDQLLHNLQTLDVWSCHSLTNLAPPTASFQNLTALNVWKCEGLMFLLTSSTAKSLVQLAAMSVKECNMVTEIIAREGDEEETDVIFSKLESLTLDNLASLASFCVAHFSLKFPSLTKVIVSGCPNMKVFSHGALSTPKLMGVKFMEEENDGHWHGNLNTTIQQLFIEMVGFRGLQQLKLSEFPKLKDMWHGELLGEFFCDLKSLVVEDCATFSSAISSNLLLSLNNLEELSVRNCESLEQIFNLQRLNEDQGHVGLLSKLEKFYLIDLPKLSHLWNRYSQRIVDLRGLKSLKVHNCRSLRNIFTPSIGAVLLQLQELEVKWCPMIEEIITKGSGEEVKTDKIIFPQLNFITLESLPNLTSFYCGMGTVECPSLKKIHIVDCLSTFTSTFLRELEPNSNGAAEPKIVYPSLEVLILSSINVEKIWHNKPGDCFVKLTNLTVEGLGKLKYLFTSSMVKSLVQLKRLEITNCKLMEEIIRTERGIVSEMGFPKLDFLKLGGLKKLIRFCSCMLFECASLKELHIENCPALETFIYNYVSADRKSTLFDEKVVVPNLEELPIFFTDNLKKIWHDELHSDSFCKLRVLKVKHGKKLLKIFHPMY